MTFATATVQDIGTGIAVLLEPDPTPPDPATVTRDATGAQPFAWKPDTLYVYPIASGEVPIETGPTARQDFAFLAVFVADSHEEADQERRAEVSAQLDTKRAQYIDIVRHNRTSLLWDQLRATERPTPPRTLQSRAVAIELRGYRILS